MFRFPFTFLLELLKDVRELKRCEKLVRGMKIQREKKKTLQCPFCSNDPAEHADRTNVFLCFFFSLLFSFKRAI